ncbi:MAG: hypothetical protein KAQ92_05190, partial [Candidatus Aenigmarchaeota archaeon]|nr:hypothetical protein [Candidatus Aenigmarchaeota archaeon]
MKSDNLIDSIVKDAQKQEKEIIETAKKEAEQKAKIIVDSAKKDAKQAEKDAIEKAKEKKNEKIYKYEQDAKNIVLAGKKKLLCQLFEEATENIKNIENPKRKEILKNLFSIAKRELE